MSATRVTFVGPVEPHRGGVAQHSTRLVAALRSLGYEVEVVTWRSMYPKRLYPGADTRLTEAEIGVALLSWWNPLSWLRAGWIARRGDLTVMPWITPFHSVVMRVIQAVARRPLVVIVHNVSPHEPFPMSGVLAKWGLRRATRFVVHAGIVALELTSMGLGQPTITVAHPPNLDIEPTPLPPYPPYRLLCLGFVRPYKGVDLAIRALAMARSKGWDADLTVAGEVWDGGLELGGLVEDLGLAEHVQLDAGYVPDRMMSRLLSQHHALVASYRSASQSGVVSLALAAGRPVVVTPVGGLAETIETGRSGVIARSLETADVAEAMIACMSDVRRLSAGAATASLSWSRVAMAVIGDERRGSAGSR